MDEPTAPAEAPAVEFREPPAAEPEGNGDSDSGGDGDTSPAVSDAP